MRSKMSLMCAPSRVSRIGATNSTLALKVAPCLRRRRRMRTTVDPSPRRRPMRNGGRSAITTTTSCSSTRMTMRFVFSEVIMHATKCRQYFFTQGIAPRNGLIFEKLLIFFRIGPINRRTEETMKAWTLTTTMCHRENRVSSRSSRHLAESGKVVLCILQINVTF